MVMILSINGRGGCGRMIYVPKPVLDKLFFIKKVKGKKRNSEAWCELGKMVDVGLNVDDVYSALFGVKK